MADVLVPIGFLTLIRGIYMFQGCTARIDLSYAIDDELDTDWVIHIDWYKKKHLVYFPFLFKPKVFTNMEVDICRTYHKLPLGYTSRINTCPTLTRIIYKRKEIRRQSQI